MRKLAIAATVAAVTILGTSALVADESQAGAAMGGTEPGQNTGSDISPSANSLTNSYGGFYAPRAPDGLKPAPPPTSEPHYLPSDMAPKPAPYNPHIPHDPNNPTGAMGDRG